MHEKNITYSLRMYHLTLAVYTHYLVKWKSRKQNKTKQTVLAMWSSAGCNTCIQGHFSVASKL